MSTRRLINKEIEFLNGVLNGIPSANEMDPEHLQAAIAQAAYSKAERRGFAPGHELSDWLAAECEVCNQRSGASAHTF